MKKWGAVRTAIDQVIQEKAESFDPERWVELMQEIVDRVYLGEVGAAASLALLQQAGITHIVNLATSSSFFPQHFKYLRIAIMDRPEEPIRDKFVLCNDFISEALADPEARILVHCQAGISRSSTIVIAYLMSCRSMTLDDAFHLVKKKRPCVCPNEGFQMALIEHHRELHGSESPVTVFRPQKSFLSPLAMFLESLETLMSPLLYQEDRIPQMKKCANLMNLACLPPPPPPTEDPTPQLEGRSSLAPQAGHQQEQQGKTFVSKGPPKFLSPEDLIQEGLMVIWRRSKDQARLLGQLLARASEDNIPLERAIHSTLIEEAKTLAEGDVDMQKLLGALFAELIKADILKREEIDSVGLDPALLEKELS